MNLRELYFKMNTLIEMYYLTEGKHTKEELIDAIEDFQRELGLLIGVES